MINSKGPLRQAARTGPPQLAREGGAGEPALAPDAVVPWGSHKVRSSSPSGEGPGEARGGRTAGRTRGG